MKLFAGVEQGEGNHGIRSRSYLTGAVSSLLTALEVFIFTLLPLGLVDTTGTTPKYPEVRIFSCKMSSRMLFLQSSPLQFRHVALLLAVE